MGLFSNTYYFVVIIGAMAGFALAFYIHHTKNEGTEKLICPVGGGCDVVTESTYSKFFGFPVELLGMIYYVVVAVAYLVLLAFPNVVTVQVAFWIMSLTITAVLFSAYLVFIQAFVIKHWCIWCLTSAFLCLVIFMAAILGSRFGLVTLLFEYSNLIFFVHIIGLILGLGGATFMTAFFFRFLRDLRISVWEADIIRFLSEASWVGLAVLVVTGVGLYLPRSLELGALGGFWVKVWALMAVIISGALLNFIVSPKLISISFAVKHDHQSGELRRARRLAFVFGAIYMVSWYSVLVFDLIKTSDLSFSLLLSIYLLVVVLSVVISLVIEKNLGSKSV